MFSRAGKTFAISQKMRSKKLKKVCYNVYHRCLVEGCLDVCPVEKNLFGQPEK